MAEVEEKTRRSRRGGVRVVLKDTTNSRDAQKSAKEKFKKKVFKDPDALRVFRASEAERKRRAYHARKDDENERDKLKEKWKRNAKAYRERKRAEKLAAHANGSSGNKGKPGTRQEKKAHDETKQKHADYMRQYRAGMSRQKRTAVNRKRMEKYYMSKEQEVHSVPTDHVPVAAPCQSSPTLQPTSSQQTPPPPSQSPLRDISQPPTKTALQKATQRFRNILGKGARAAHVLKRLIKSADRETKESYRKLNITADTPEKTPAAIVGAFEKMKKKRNKTAIAAKKLIYENAPSMPRPRARKRPVSSKTKAKMIADFYESQSVPLPSKKTVSSKTKQQVRVLDKSVKKLYKDFVKLNPSCSVSKSTFYRHRPHHVKLYTKFPKYQCLCDICQNVSLKLKVLNKFLPVDVQMRDKYDFQKNLMCFGDEPNPDCISMTCTACGPSILKDKLFSSIPFDTLSKWTTWFSWEYKIQSDGKKKKCLEEKSNSVKQLINDLITEATDSIFSQHVFVAKWQQEKFHDLCNNLRDHSAVLVIDYAENYRCSYQSEIQSAYFAYKQVTVHPAVVYYKCSDCGKRVNHYFMFVSDDHLHDAHFSHHCQKKVIEHLKEKGIDYLYIFSDGAASQFKSKVPFSYLTELALEMTVQRCFFGSRHGKNPCDAAGGVTKKSVEDAVRCGHAVIQSAESFFDFCVKNLTLEKDDCNSHVIRNFFLVDNVNRKPSIPKLTTMPGTRKLHAIKCLGGTVFATRNLACFCAACIVDGDCVNNKYVHDWNVVKMKDGRENVDDSGSDVDVLNDAFVNVTEICNIVDDVHDCTGLREDLEAWCMDGQSAFFSGLQKALCACTTFDELVQVCQCSLPYLSNFKFNLEFNATVLSTKRSVDKVALSLRPKEFDHLYPVLTEGDGNCMPRAISTASLGSDSFHAELRCRAVLELCINREFYLSLPAFDPLQLAVLSPCAEKFSIDYSSVGDIFNAEVLDTAILCRPLGLWQLAAFSNVLGIQIVSVYPSKGPESLRVLFNSVFKPRTGKADLTISLLWTSDRQDMTEEYWVANHVVPLLPLTEPVTVVYESP